MIEVVISSIGEILLPVVALVYAKLAYDWTKRKDRLVFFESSFVDLQNINEYALKSDENLLATVQSIWPEIDPDPKKVREVYVNFIRINRLFRAWNYWKQGVLTKQEAFEIIDSHAGVLKASKTQLNSMLSMGYPENFKSDLLIRIDEAKDIPCIWIES